MRWAQIVAGVLGGYIALGAFALNYWLIKDLWGADRLWATAGAVVLVLGGSIAAVDWQLSERECK